MWTIPRSLAKTVCLKNTGNIFYTEPNNLAYKAFDMSLYFIELAAKIPGPDTGCT